MNDSLAAESIRQDGEFSANADSGISKQPSKSTTTNTTDTSNAKVLSPAPNADARLDKEGLDQDEILSHGREEAEPISNGKMEQTGGRVLEDGEMSNSIHGKGSNTERISGMLNQAAGTADAGKYSRSNHASKQPDAHVEKGDAFEGPNASFNGDIGGDGDPGRLAEDKFIKSNAQNAANAGRERDFGGADKGHYEVLSETPA